MEPITFGSVCSGIGAPEAAWEPLGWRSVFQSEIERFPRAVLEQRQHAVDARRTGAASRGVPLWGDFTAMRMRFFRRLGIQLPDVLVGGTPCQAFSVAGLRQSLADARGNLSLEFVRLANAIDNERRRLGRGGIVVGWENVPGVLSTKDNAFGCFLAGLVGADAPLVPPRGQRWTDAGLVAGPRRVAAWRILDSQYFGLAQRRERVFVVASPLDGVDPAEILLELDGVRRDSPPRREAQADVAQALTRSLGAGGADDNKAQARHLIAFGGNNTAGPIDVATALNACSTASGRQDFETETFVAHVAPTLDANYGRLYGQDHQHANAGYGLFVAHTLRGEGFDVSEGGAGRGAPLVPVLATTLRARPGAKGVDSDGTDTLVPVAYRTAGDGAVYEEGDCTAPLTTGTDASASIVAFDTTQVTSAGNYSSPKPGAACHPLAAGAHAPAIAFSCKDHGADAGDIAPTLRAMNHVNSHMSGGGQVAVAIPILEPGRRSGRSTDDPSIGLGIGADGDPMFTLPADRPHGVGVSAGVRRLMPVECERLQGFPDHYTLIEVRSQPAADSPRYKALGNSMSVPVMAWIGERIDRALKTRGTA